MTDVSPEVRPFFHALFASERDVSFDCLQKEFVTEGFQVRRIFVLCPIIQTDFCLEMRIMLNCSVEVMALGVFVRLETEAVQHHVPRVEELLQVVVDKLD